MNNNVDQNTQTLIFQPVLPKLAVTKISTSEQVIEISAFIEAHPRLFLNLPNDPKEVDLIVKDDRVLIPSSDYDSYGAAEIIFKIGDYLVVSENGKRYFTSNDTVKHGVFDKFPARLFTPIEGTKLDEPSFV